MNVVMRCPNCGTTQAAPGECEACHEAQVRYFCTVHGSWLDGPMCPQCAVVSVPPPARPRPPARAPARSPSPSPSPSLDREPAASPLWATVLRTALARKDPARVELSLGGWLAKVAVRLLIVVMVLGLALAGAIYWLAHSLD